MLKRLWLKMQKIHCEYMVAHFQSMIRHSLNNRSYSSEDRADLLSCKFHWDAQLRAVNRKLSNLFVSELDESELSANDSPLWWRK